MTNMPSLPDVKAAQEIKGIFERHKERTSNVAPIISIGESLKEHFNNFIRRELDDIQRQLEILQPWFQVTEEEQELQRLELGFEKVRVKLDELLKSAKHGSISMESLDLSAIQDVFVMIDAVEKLWYKVERWSLTLLRQADMFKQWLQEMLPKE